MEPAAQTPDPVTSLALRQLADITQPPPVSWMPQTWGWAVLALILAALALFALLRWRRHWLANRYRRDALAELALIESDLGDPAARVEALAAMPELLKRVALAAWRRPAVARLSGGEWLAFLRAHGAAGAFDGPAGRLLDDLEYRPAKTRDGISEDEARLFAASARRWIEGHVVSA